MKENPELQSNYKSLSLIFGDTCIDLTKVPNLLKDSSALNKMAKRNYNADIFSFVLWHYGFSKDPQRS